MNETRGPKRITSNNNCYEYALHIAGLYNKLLINNYYYSDEMNWKIVFWIFNLLREDGRSTISRLRPFKIIYIYLYVCICTRSLAVCAYYTLKQGSRVGGRVYEGMYVCGDGCRREAHRPFHRLRSGGQHGHKSVSRKSVKSN